LPAPDDLTEGFQGTSFSHNGVTYSNVNDVAGVFPDGSTFNHGELGPNVIVERATLLYNDFPDFGSANNALTFGTTFVPGDNLSLGALASVDITPDSVSDFVSLEMAYFELGPWSGITYALTAFLNGSVVGEDSFVIAGNDLNERDRIAFATLMIDGVQFDALQLTATFDTAYSGPRILLDNLTLNSVPAPASALAFGGLAVFAGRRRR